MHLSRQRARELPSLIPISEFDAQRCDIVCEALRTHIRRDGEPVTGFVPGWHPDALSLLFYPTLILQFRHDQGGSAFWLLDASFRYVAAAMSALPHEARISCRRRAASIATFLDGIGQDGLSCRIPDDVASFSGLAAETCRAILDEFGLPCAADWSQRLSISRPQDCTDFHAAVEAEAGRHFVGPNRRVELRARGEPVALLPGWRIERISSLFFPVLVADLHHEDGRSAYWFFGRDGSFIADHWTLLPQPCRLVVASHVETMLEDLWQDVVAHPGCGTRDHVEALLALPPATRDAVCNLRQAAADGRETATWALSEPPGDDLPRMLPGECRELRLDPGFLDEALRRPMQQQNVVLANEGAVTWPSPVDGSALAASGFALLFDHLCFAYRVQDPQAGFTFYVIGLREYFCGLAIYLPAIDLLVTRNLHDLRLVRRMRGARYGEDFLRHALYYGEAILAGARRPPGPIYHSFRGRHAMHVGHFFWQDLCGVHDFLGAVRPDRLPRFLVPEAHLKPELYGPIDAVFPCLSGHVERCHDSFGDMIPALYEAHARVIKATSVRVPRAVGSAIVAAYRRASGCRDLVARIRRVRRRAGGVLLLGLRVGNRTVIDPERFAVGLAAAMWDAYPELAIVVDGQNAGSHPVYGSYGDDPAAPGSFLRQELDIAAALSDEATSRGATLIDNIGRPMADSVLWCEAADFFVAPWGAALAKYRWVCNKPGLVVTGRWNLQHRLDLPIYHSVECNEDPAEIWFNDPATVEDVADADEPGSSRERSNFRIDDAAIHAQLIDLLGARRRRDPANCLDPRRHAELPVGSGTPDASDRHGSAPTCI